MIYLLAGRIKAFFVCIVMISLVVFSANTALAGVWLDPGDSGFRSDLRLLVDKGVLDISVNTWPVSTRDIAGQLISETDSYGFEIFRKVPADLQPHVRKALRRVRQRVELEQKTLKADMQASLANKPRFLRMSRDLPVEGSEFGAGLDISSKYAFARGRVSYVSEPEDDRELRADGSYLGLQLGNWALTFGAQDRWWGPGYDGSLIYSNNPRPVPGIALQRVSGLFPWADWIDYIQFRSFMGELESDREVPEAKLFANRLEISFFDRLEVGLSRAGMWGGQGQPEDADGFVDYVTGRESSKYGDGEGLTEPGDHMAGYDWRLRILDELSLYGQYIGEDAQHNLPFSFMGLFGLEGTAQLGNSGAYVNWYLEYSDTLIAPFRPSDNKRPGVAYHHGIYKDGNRYRGRCLGHTIDGDSRLLSAGTVLMDSRGWTWSLHLAGGSLNKKGKNTPSKSIVALDENIDVYKADASLRYPVSTAHSVKAAVGGLQREFSDSHKRLDGYFSLTWKKSFDLGGMIF